MSRTGAIRDGLSELVAMARDPSRGSRSNLYLAISNLFETQGHALSENERALMREIMRSIVHQVEMSVRMALAERLAERPEAPHDLILLLANDRIEVARLVIERSMVLNEEDLLAIIQRTSIAHQKAVAGRPDVTEAVSAALSESICPEVLETLIRNTTAKISHATLHSLAERAKNIPALHEPLVTRPGIPGEIAVKLYAAVSDALKSFIVQHFEMDRAQLDRLVAQAEADAINAETPASSARLVDKLYAAGQLKPSFLLKALAEGQKEIFELGFAKLLGLEAPKARNAIYGKGPVGLALACRAVGIDKSVFVTLFNQTRAAVDAPMLLTPQEKTESDRVFASLEPQAAREKLRVSIAA